MNEATKPTVKKRLLEELVKYGYLTAYLWVCFSVLLLFQTTSSDVAGTTFHFGAALIKALLVGKFLLIGDAIKVGSIARGPTLVHRVVWKSIAFLLILLIFTVIEEIIVGWFHDKTMVQSVVEYFSRPLPVVVAPILIMLLILIPLIAAIELRKTIGEEKWKDIWRGQS